MSNKRKKGKISEDLTREYVSLNYSYKIAEWGIWEQVFKNQTREDIGEFLKWAEYPGYKNINDKPGIFLLDWWLELFLPLVTASSVSWKNHSSRILRADPLPE